MMGVAYTDRTVFRRGMVLPVEKPSRLSEAQRYGLALKRLRKRYDVSQGAAAERAGTYQQTWQRYERGANDAFLKVDLQERLVEALGATWPEFQAELDAIDSGAPPSAQPMRPQERALRRLEFPLDGRVRASAQGIHVYDGGDSETFDAATILPIGTRFLRIAGDSVVPYAEAGGVLSYNVHELPKRGKGCVILLNDGTFFVKIYKRIESGTLHVVELKPALIDGMQAYVESPMEFDLSDVKGVYPVGVRAD
jgi:transcriptional regulator with XRE-family HTH domain